MEGSGRRALRAAVLCLAVVATQRGAVHADTKQATSNSPCVFDHTYLRSSSKTCRPRAKAYPSYVHGKVQRAIYDSAVLFGVPYKVLAQVAQCESSMNPQANNGGHIGLFQFLPATFRRGAQQLRGATGVVARSAWKPEDASYVAGYLFTLGEATSWTCEPASR